MSKSGRLEEWRDISGYEGLYQVSNMGKVRNCKGKLLKPQKHIRGYLCVGLCKNGTYKRYTIHRLVALAFCENPFGFDEVNHIDEDKQNNRYDNLEWCSHLYNVNYGNRPRKVGRYVTDTRDNTVKQYTKEGTFIREFRSLREAERITKFSRDNISIHIDNKKPLKGFIWRR